MSRTRTPSVSLSTSSGEFGYGPSSFEGESLCNSGIGTSNSSEDVTSRELSRSDLTDSLAMDLRRLADALSQFSAEISTKESSPAPPSFVEMKELENKGTNQVSPCVRVNDLLNSILRPFWELIDRYPFLNSSEVLTTLSTLIQSVKDVKFDSGTKVDYGQVRDNLVKLQAVLVEKVGYHLTWDLNSPMSTAHIEESNHRYNSGNLPEIANGALAVPSLDALLHSSSGMRSDWVTLANGSGPPRPLLDVFVQDMEVSGDKIDNLLFASRIGVEHALERAKAWSKYAKELIVYVQKRIALEVRHATDLRKLNDTIRDNIREEKYLPLKKVYQDGFDYESEFCEACCDSMKQLFEFKFIKPLEARRHSHEKRRRELKEIWQRHLKNVREAQIELDKAKQVASNLDHNFRKARESALRLELQPGGGDRTKVEKRRRTEEEAMIRREAATKDCKFLESKLDSRCADLRQIKAEIIKETRELIYQCDQTTKACTSTYFQALATLWSAAPLKYQALSDKARTYIPGDELRNFVENVSASRLPGKRHSLRRAHSDDELFLQRTDNLPCRSPSSGATIQRPSASYNSVASADFCVEPIGQESTETLNMTASKTSISSMATPNISDKVSRFKRKGVRKNAKRRNTVSLAAKTHQFEKFHVPAKCAHCGSYTFFQTVQCVDCSTVCHKNCLEKLATACSEAALSANPRAKMAVFGVALEVHLTETQTKVPRILFQCLTELDKRGTRLKGLYRVPGVMSQIESLCQDFDEGKMVDLSQVHPNVIASVAKLYIKQLPETLLTLKLYPEFIDLARRYEKAFKSNKDIDQEVVKTLRTLIHQLPPGNSETIRLLLLHLKRLTWFESENQMNASNLGIVFGPTLMHSSSGDENGNPSLTNILETPHQNRVTELLITHAYEIYEINPTDEWERFHEFLAIEESEPDERVSKKFSQEESYESTLFGIGQSQDRRTTSATPDLLKNRPPLSMQHSPGSSNSDANSEAGTMEPQGDANDVIHLLIQESRAIVAEFQQNSSSSRENSVPAPEPKNTLTVGNLKEPGSIIHGSSPSNPELNSSSENTENGSAVKDVQKFLHTPVRRQKLVILRTNSVKNELRPKSEVITGSMRQENSQTIHSPVGSSRSADSEVRNSSRSSLIPAYSASLNIRSARAKPASSPTGTRNNIYVTKVQIDNNPSD